MRVEDDAPQLLEVLQGTAILASVQLMSSCMRRPADSDILQSQYDQLHNILNQAGHLMACQLLDG